MSERWAPGGLADRMSRLIWAVERYNRDAVRAYCDEVEAIAMENARLRSTISELIAERERLRAEVSRLECGPWVECGFCRHTVYVNHAMTCPKCGSDIRPA